VLGDQRRNPGSDRAIAAGLDVAVAVGAGAGRLAWAVALRPAGLTAVGVLRLGRRVLHAGLGHPRLTELAGRGEQVRDGLEGRAADALRFLLRRVVEGSLAAIDLTELILAHVDLDAVAAALDVDAVIARADVDAVVARTDLDAIARTIDVDAIVARVDLDAIIDRVDIDRVASHIDLDAIIDRVDIDRVASHIDLDTIIERVDPDVVVARVDIEALLARLDLAEIARQVIDAIDLPGILRQSTGAVSSQAARVVRSEGMNADESVSRFIDRVLRRPHTQPAGTP
jgi:hypothetical protein